MGIPSRSWIRCANRMGNSLRRKLATCMRTRSVAVCRSTSSSLNVFRRYSPRPVRMRACNETDVCCDLANASIISLSLLELLLLGWSSLGASIKENVRIGFLSWHCVLLLATVSNDKTPWRFWQDATTAEKPRVRVDGDANETRLLFGGCRCTSVLNPTRIILVVSPTELCLDIKTFMLLFRVLKDRTDPTYLWRVPISLDVERSWLKKRVSKRKASSKRRRQRRQHKR